MRDQVRDSAVPYNKYLPDHSKRKGFVESFNGTFRAECPFSFVPSENIGTVPTCKPLSCHTHGL